MRLKIGNKKYDLVFKDFIVLQDGRVLNGLVDHNKQTIQISTGGGKRSRREILDTLLHECGHALARQDDKILTKNEEHIMEWVGFHIGNLLYVNRELFESLMDPAKKEPPYHTDREAPPW